MASISREYIVELGSRAVKAGATRNSYFSALSEKHGSRIATSLYGECTVHLIAVLRTTAELVQELQLWATTYRKTDCERTNKIVQWTWDRAVGSTREMCESHRG